MLLALLVLSTAQVQVTVTPDLKKASLAVELELGDWKGDCLCLDKSVGEALTGLEKHPQREDCYQRPAKGPVKYQVGLTKLRRMHDDPDFACELGSSWMFHDATFLLRADDFDTDYRVRFVVPEGVSVSAPWPRDEKGVFTVSAAQFDVGSYVALGKLRVLDTVKFDGFSARITLVDEPKKASDAQLVDWVSRALKTHGAFYGGSPTRGTLPIHIVLAGVGSDDAGVFGSVLRRGDPSVMLLFGRNATSGFESDWVAVHELFHLGNPPTKGRFPWLTEGFTTYYTEVLRGRSGALPVDVAWGTLAESLREYCSPNGTSLAEASRTLGQNHDYLRVYWGGACLAFRLDVAIRKKSKGARSLDTVLRELRVGPALDEGGVLAALDAAAGGLLASKHLEQKKGVLPFEDALTELGVGAVEDGKARLNDSAPLATLRKAMMR